MHGGFSGEELQPFNPDTNLNCSVSSTRVLEVLVRGYLFKGKRLALLHQLDGAELHAKLVLVKLDARVPGGGGDAPPVGVMAIDGSFGEGGPGDRQGNLRVWERWGWHH